MAPAPSPECGADTTLGWRGQTWFGPGWAMFRGWTGDNAPHAHHALQLALAPHGRVTVWIEPGGAISVPGVLIAPDVVHALVPSGEPVWLLYLERETDAGRALARTCRSGVRALDAAEREALVALWPCGREVRSGPDPLLAGLGFLPAASTPGHDAGNRIQALAESLSSRPDLNVSVAALAREVALSPSRFAHCFKLQVGMAVRPYLRWLRLRRALAGAATGQSLTHAAHAAGFADAAHLTRTMRRHFGVKPSDVLAALRAWPMRSIHRPP